MPKLEVQMRPAWMPADEPNQLALANGGALRNSNAEVVVHADVTERRGVMVEDHPSGAPGILWIHPGHSHAAVCHGEDRIAFARDEIDTLVSSSWFVGELLTSDRIGTFVAFAWRAEPATGQPPYKQSVQWGYKE